MFELSPSLSAGSQLNLGEVLDRTRELSHIHLDVDDGNFVHEITFGMDTVATAFRLLAPMWRLCRFPASS